MIPGETRTQQGNYRGRHVKGNRRGEAVTGAFSRAACSVYGKTMKTISVRYGCPDIACPHHRPEHYVSIARHVRTFR